MRHRIDTIAGNYTEDIEILHSKSFQYFCLFIAINSVKCVLVDSVCDYWQPDLFIIANLYISFVFIFISFLISIKMGSKTALLVLYLLQSLFFIVNICYIDTFTVPVDLTSCYKLWWETLCIIDKISIHFSVKSILLIVIDLPYLMLFLKKYDQRMKIFFSGKYVAYILSFILISSLCMIVAITEIFAVPSINYFEHSRRSGSALIHRYGLIAFHMFDTISNINSNDKDLQFDYGQEIVNFGNKRKASGIVLIQVESLDARIIDYTVHDRYVTPFLHDLSRRSIYYPYTMSYHKSGGSSDCDIAVLNSLEPLDDYPTMKSTTYAYPNSMIRVLSRNGYTSTAFHGNTGEFYNRDYAYHKMGFDYFYDRKRMDLAEEGWGASDEKVLAFTEAKLGRNNKPFVSYIITMSSHEPFKNVGNYYRNNHFAEVVPTLAKNYLTSMAYVDKVLNEFITRIRKEHPGTYIFIYGDHTPYAVKSGPFQRSSIYMEDKNFEFVPLIIVTPNRLIYHEKKDAASFLDIAPTVLSVAGIPFQIRTYGENLLSFSLHKPIPLSGKFYSRSMLYRKITDSFDLQQKNGE